MATAVPMMEATPISQQAVAQDELVRGDDLLDETAEVKEADFRGPAAMQLPRSVTKCGFQDQEQRGFQDQ
jgi:hypothetical protein